MYRIAIDGGGLLANQNERFGNYTVSRELVNALSRLDRQNAYTIYTFADLNLPLPDNFAIKKLRPKTGWMKLAVPIEELMNPKHIFLAVNQAIPPFTRSKVIAFSHGTAPFLYPDFYPGSGGELRKQTRDILERAEMVIVSSIKVLHSFNDIIVPSQKGLSKIKTLPYGIPKFLLEEHRRYKKKKIVLHVSSGHAIKNTPLIIEAFALLSQKAPFRDYKLVLAGVPVSSLATLPAYFKIERSIISAPHASENELTKLYNEAGVLVTASYYESFNLPVLEALSQGTQVVGTEGALVPELKGYAHTAAGTATGLASAMVRALSVPKPINVTGLRHKFSWEKYARQIIEFYEAI